MIKRKSVLLLAGQLRTFDHPVVRKSWSKFISENDVTVYGCFWDKRGKSNDAIRTNVSPEMNQEEPMSLDRVKDVFSTDKISFRNHNEFMASLPHEYRGFTSNRFFGALFCQGFIRSEVTKMVEADSQPIIDAAYTLTRPDFIWFRKPPESVFVASNKLCHPDSPQAHYPNRVYDTLLSSNRENILKIGKMYSDTDGLLRAIASNHNGTLDPFDMCRVYYNYAINNRIMLTNWDYLYGDIFRTDTDVQYYEMMYAHAKLWCLV